MSAAGTAILSFADSVVDRIRISEPVIRLRVGELEGTREDMFGLISDVAMDGAGHVYVADSRMLELKRYGPDGALLAQVGRAGSGPGEFRFLEQIDLGSDGNLYALDAGNLRISRYSTAGGKLQPIAAIRLPMIARDMCLLGNRIFVVGLHQERILHEIDGSGRLLRSFGSTYPANEVPEGRMRQSFQGTMSEGWIACAEEGKTVILAARNRGDVRAFSPDGVLRWRVHLQDFYPMGVKVIPGGIQFEWNSDIRGAHHVETLTPAPDGRLLVQTALLREGVAKGEPDLETRVLSLRDGTELARLEGLPFITAAVGDQLAGYEILPFPQVVFLATNALPGHK